MEPLAILVDRLSHQFQHKEVLKEVNLQIHPNTIYGLVGKNGAGKTTLLHLITHQLISHEGRIEVFGKDPRKENEVLEKICFMGEESFYAPYMKVKDICKLYQQFYSGYDMALQTRLMTFFELPAHKTLRQYSRGMKSLLFVIIALCSKAEITILDEPTLGMDAENREVFYKILLEEYLSEPRTFIISTHLINEIEHLIERLIILDQGKITLDKSVEDLKNESYYLLGTDDAFAHLEEKVESKLKGGIGSKKIYTYWGKLDLEKKEQMRQLGIEIGPMSLQEIFLEKVGRKEYRDEGY